MSDPIYIVDVFTQKPYSGNPTAVMIVEEFRNDMQFIAAEMHLSEMAFVKPLAENSFHIRWFSPTAELVTCGHATFAAAHVLYQENLTQEPEIQFESQPGPLKVSRDDESFFTLNFAAGKVTNILAKQPYENIFGLVGEVIEVAQSAEDVIVSVRTETHLRAIVPNFNKIIEINARGIIMTAPSANTKYDFVCRYFSPRTGVNESPITIAVYCKLAEYWANCMKKTELKGAQANFRGGFMQMNLVEDRVEIKCSTFTMMTGIWLVEPPQITT